MGFLGVIVIMVVAFTIGVPVAYSILAPSVIYILTQNIPLVVIPEKLSNGVESFPLLAVPFFIAAGELMNTGGVTRRLVTLASTVVGHMTGGLAHVVIVANMIMAGMSGSALADAAGTGRVLIPSMVQEGYSKPFAAALVASAGTIGPIIPPSIAFVLYGFIASTSVGRLFVVLIIVAAANVLQYIATRESVDQLLLAAFSPIAGNKVLALIYINVLFLALGCVMETTALLLLFTPIFLPLIDALGIDRVHFGVFFVLNLMIGTITPPVGTVMYIVLNISKVKMIDFVREVWPMLIALTAVLFLITFYPPAVMFIPNLLMGAAK